MAKITANILLRTEPVLHKRLLREAKLKDLSLHELCLRRILMPTSLESSQFNFLRTPVCEAAKLWGPALLGAVLYGSQARSESRTTSDWDLLFVLGPDVAINRSLYRRWDRDAEGIDERLEIHFAHLPEKSSIATGFWAEIALDGTMLYDAEFRVSKHLNQVRREIVAGLITRKVVHGQPYWVHTEVA